MEITASHLNKPHSARVHCKQTQILFVQQLVVSPLPPSTMTVIKIGHNGHTRKITHEGSPPTWGWLSFKISELYRIPKDDVALSYLDSDNEQVTLSTEAELHDYFTSFMRPGEVARFTVQRVSTPAVKQVDEDGEGDHPKEASKEATPSEEWQNVETIPNDHKPDAIVYEEVWRSVDDVNGHPYIPGLDAQALNILAAIGVANHAPDLSRPVPLSPRSTATLIKVFTEKNAEDSEDEDSTTHPLPEAAEKGKNKPSQPESATPAQHVDSARSVRGSEADPAALDPPLPTTSLDTVPAPSPAPSVPNIAGDLSQMLQAITNAFTTHPELSEGVRRVIRLATDNNYLESERQRLIQTVNDAVSEATVAARNGVDDASTGLNDALQGIFDALQNGLAAASAAAAYEEGRHHRPLPSSWQPSRTLWCSAPTGTSRTPAASWCNPAPTPGVPEQAIHIQPHFGTEALPFGGYPSRARQGSRAPSGSVPRGPAGAYPTYALGPQIEHYRHTRRGRNDGGSSFWS
ncbi:uncharacterized protein EI90DRAFT_2526934 [Cantharellus anzutake]|uniref:uncharacterized protein n=1 Tax=Cantharellus anzutake TaxID=1750568 RepID=UPI001906820A|nr:uncharacterized protein EI90DRAFT_2526934 [Cantharellus anzutake]KAF8337983.1 hypothetical protein EI90DRAFT_2526934 [Cantharellus anzutake]